MLVPRRSSLGSTGTCPDGWTQTPSGCVNATATQCPAGFTQRAPGECWPDTAASCVALGMFYNPAQPDRCRKACPSETWPNAAGVCGTGSQATVTDDSLSRALPWAVAGGVVLASIFYLFTRRP